MAVFWAFLWPVFLMVLFYQKSSIFCCIKFYFFVLVFLCVLMYSTSINKRQAPDCINKKQKEVL